MADWLWQVTDLAFNPYADVTNSKEMRVAFLLNKVNTASFKLRLTHPASASIMENLGYLKVYRDSRLIFFGPIITAQEAGEGDVENASVHVNASGPEWIFAQRLAARTEATAKRVEGVEWSKRFTEYVEERNAENETHIDVASGPIGGGATLAYETPMYRPASEILNDFVNTTNGFDWRMTPIDNYSGGVVVGQKIGRFETANVLNIAQPNSIFEWGMGLHNVAAYSRTVDRSTLLNKAYHILSEGPEVTNGLVTSDPTLGAESIAKWGLQEAVISASLVDVPLREELINEHVTVRRNPRQTIVFQPTSSPQTPTYGRDFSLGDSVTARIGYQGVARYQALLRVWGVSFELDENLRETQLLTLSDS